MIGRWWVRLLLGAVMERCRMGCHYLVAARCALQYGLDAAAISVQWSRYMMSLHTGSPDTVTVTERAVPFRPPAGQEPQAVGIGNDKLGSTSGIGDSLMLLPMKRCSGRRSIVQPIIAFFRRRTFGQIPDTIAIR